MSDTANDNDDDQVDDQQDDAIDQEVDDVEQDVDEGGDDENAVDTDDEGDHFDRAYVQKLRRENATARRKHKDELRKAREEAEEAARDEFARDLYSALGLGDDDEVDPDEVIEAANRQAYQAVEQLRAYQIKDALGDAARTHKADLGLLIPHLRGTGVLDDLDPNDDDFSDQVSEVVESALDKNPKLRANAPAARRSAGDTSGGNNEKKAPAPNEIEEIIAARRKHREKRFGIKYS